MHTAMETLNLKLWICTYNGQAIIPDTKKMSKNAKKTQNKIERVITNNSVCLKDINPKISHILEMTTSNTIYKLWINILNSLATIPDLQVQDYDLLAKTYIHKQLM